MKKIEKIAINIAASREIMKYINSDNYYTIDNFIKDAESYLYAIKTSSMLCVILSVSASGMSRVLNFKSVKKSGYRYNFRNYSSFFKALGYCEVNNGFRISGAGMNMVFYTNYTIIHKLYRLGFIDKNTCDVLEQNTPITL
jgi:hypothetical protein